MKKIFISGLLAVLILGSSFHFSMVYLNYIHTLGIGFSPELNTLTKADIAPASRKDILQVKW